jgi:sensor histidine kinase YesM
MKNEKGGVGIENIIKRLDLIYGSSAILKIKNTNDEYFVRLTVPLEINKHE